MRTDDSDELPDHLEAAGGDPVLHPAYGSEGATELTELTSGGLWQSLPAGQRGDAVAVDDDRWLLAIGPLS